VCYTPAERFVPELSVVIPTYNERENLTPLLEALAKTLAFVDYEVIVVDDDSTDNTAAAARSIAQRNSRVRVLQRIGRRGLASAVVEGMLAASAPLLLLWTRICSTMNGLFRPC